MPLDSETARWLILPNVTTSCTAQHCSIHKALLMLFPSASIVPINWGETNTPYGLDNMISGSDILAPGRLAECSTTEQAVKRPKVAAACDKYGNKKAKCRGGPPFFNNTVESAGCFLKEDDLILYYALFPLYSEG
jgi:hypothetical protein